MAKFKSLIWTQVFQLVSRFKKYILIISDPEGSLFESELDNFFQRVKCEVLVILGPMNGRWRSVEGELMEGAQVGFTEKQEEAEDCLSSQPGTRHQPPHITFIF